MRAVGAVEGEFLRERKDQEGSGLRIGFTLGLEVSDPCRESKPWRRVVPFELLLERRCNVREASGPERARRLCKGKKP